MEEADTRMLTVVGFTGRRGSGRTHMGKMLWRTHGFYPLSFGDGSPAELEARLLEYAEANRHHRFVVTDVKTFEQAELIHSLGGFLIWLRGRSKIEDESYDPIECDFSVDNSLHRNMLAEEEIRRFIMGWLIANANG